MRACAKCGHDGTGTASSCNNNVTRLSLTGYDGGSAGGNRQVTQTTAYKDNSTADSTS